jgi:hypothetical protein
VLWYDTLDALYNRGTPLTVLKEMSDSNVVVTGNLDGGFNVADTTDLYIEYACLIRYRPNGEKVWMRKYSYNNDSLSSTIYDMKQTSDGGYILCGALQDFEEYYSPPYYQGWLLKVDSNGCESLTDPQCLPAKVNNVNPITNNIKIYPNPANNEVTVLNVPIAILPCTHK